MLKYEKYSFIIIITKQNMKYKFLDTKIINCNSN